MHDQPKDQGEGPQRVLCKFKLNLQTDNAIQLLTISFSLTSMESGSPGIRLSSMAGIRIAVPSSRAIIMQSWKHKVHHLET